LVAIPSESRLSNRPVLALAEGILQRAGWQVRHQIWQDNTGQEKANLLACTDGSFSAELAFAAHADTVPAAPGWEDALVLRNEGDRLHGLGACDMKGFLAAMLAVVETTPVASLRRPLALVITADEEVGCLGARRLAAASDWHAKHVIVGEPTGLRPARLGRGYCLAELSLHGVAAHSAYPAKGSSAIFAAARVLAELEKLAQRWHASPDLHPTLNVGLIRGGTAKNIIPESCHLTVEFRPAGPADPAPAWAEIEAVIRGIPLPAGIRLESMTTRLDRGFSLSGSSPLLQAATQLTGHEPGEIGYNTEAPWFAITGAQTLVCGPGDMTRAHRRGEYITREELAATERFLRGCIERLCQG